MEICLHFLVFVNIVVVNISSVAQSCLTLCDPMDCSMPGFPVHHILLKLAQTHIHWVSDAIDRGWDGWTVVNREVHISFQDHDYRSFGYIYRVGLLDHMIVLFLILRNILTVLHGNCIILHFYQWYKRGPIYPHTHQNFSFLF